MSARFDVAVVGRAGDTAAVAAGAACALARRAPGHTALVVCCGDPGATFGPATAAARRLCGRLRGRGLDARATGRIVWCAAGDEDPAGEAGRAAAVGGPVVLAMCGPRAEWVEPLLEDAGVVLVAGREEDPLTALALSALHERRIAAVAVLPPDGAGGVLARTGIGVSSRWRAALPIAPAGVP